jgi:hypothetical protein
MVKNNEAKEMHKLASKLDTKLKCSDKRFDNCVRLDHKDGSSFFFHRAFVLEYKNIAFVVFTEHHGYKAFMRDEVTYMGCYKRVHPIKGKLR